MANKTKSREPGTIGRVIDVRFMEVEFAAPIGTRMVIELEDGLRLLIADDRAVETAANFIHFLHNNNRATESRSGRKAQKGGRS